MFKADIHVTLRPSILDPQGKATQHALAHLGLGAVERVRMGKYIELWIAAESAEAAEAQATEACRKLLANEVMEDFTVAIQAVEEVA